MFDFYLISNLGEKHFMFKVFNRLDFGRVVPLIYSYFWVQVHNLPSGFFAETIAKQLGNFIGSFEEYYMKQISRGFRQFMRIRVSIGHPDLSLDAFENIVFSAVGISPSIIQYRPTFIEGAKENMPASNKIIISNEFNNHSVGANIPNVISPRLTLGPIATPLFTSSQMTKKQLLKP
ncbi:hypothetical protein Gogos_011512 [Gossypium gossypioides]|uniref:DUF4283 domain-containing protein n=1 Tax=Gossypium gossypioides TaxID=34282 RepID=A0A7J9BPK2_GOSGO|nr:hypothetical protein [Gossypium gossypioides]